MKIVINESNKIIGVNTDEQFESEIILDFKGNENLILFPWRSCNLENFIREGGVNGSDWNDFVLEHTVIKTKDDFFIWGLEEDEYFLWFSPQNKEELMRIIKFEWLFYTCCIVPKGKDIKDYRYVLHMTEHDLYKGNECRSLYITEKEKGSFEREVLPTIQYKIENYNKLHQSLQNKVYYFKE